MPFASGSRTSLAYIAEVTFGTLPATPELTEIRTTGLTISPSVESARSNEIRSDRQTSSLAQVAASNAGDMNIELSPDAHDVFLEAVLMSPDWTDEGLTGSADIDFTVTVNTIDQSGADFSGYLPEQKIRITGTTSNNGIYTVKSVSTGPADTITVREDLVTEAGTSAVMESEMITNGVTERSFSIEEAQNDVGKFTITNGMRFSKLNLNAASGEILAGAFTLMGTTSTTSSATVDNDSTYTPAPTKDVFNATSNMKLLEVREVNSDGSVGAAIDMTIKSMDFTIDNQMEEQTAVANLYPVGVAARSLMAEINMEVYFQDHTIFDHMIANNNLVVRFALTNTTDDLAGDWLFFSFPGCKVESYDKPTDNKDSDVMARIKIAPILDSILSSKTVVVSKVSAA